MLDDLQALPAQVEMLLNNQENIQRFANRYLAAKDVFFIGRGVDQAISMEGSLKLKEISYIHSEAYAAGELKHGTISLIEEGTLVVAVLTQENLYKKMISNMVEVRTRGAFVMAVTVEGNTRSRKGRRLCHLHSRDQQILHKLIGHHTTAAVRGTTSHWDADAMWINQEIWQSPLQ